MKTVLVLIPVYSNQETTFQKVTELEFELSTLTFRL